MRKVLLTLCLFTFALAALGNTLTVNPNAANTDIGTNGNTNYTTAHTTADCTACSGATVAATENSGTKTAADCNPAIVHYSVLRVFINFDTSALTSAATISTATLSVKINLKSLNTQADFIRVVTNTSASDTSLAISDFGNIGTTAQASDVNVSSLVAAGSFQDFALNAAGISNISKTGVTKFGLRCGMDINSTQPTPADSDCVGNSADGTVVFWDTVGDVSANQPKLVVTYTLPGGAKKRIVFIAKATRPNVRENK